MFQALHYAVDEATADESVKVIILQGAGSSFCAGFDFAGGFHHWDAAIATDNQWDAGRDLVMVTHHQLG